MKSGLEVRGHRHRISFLEDASKYDKSKTTLFKCMNLLVLIPAGPVTNKRPCGACSAEYGACITRRTCSLPPVFFLFRLQLLKFNYFM